MKNSMMLADIQRTTKMPVSDVVVIDTETTGLNPGKDEVLSIAIVDSEGNEVFYSLIRPLERKRWPSATEIHGITWSDVKDKPTIYDVGNEVADILSSASLIVGYNVNFDMDMLEENGLPSVGTPRYDLMEEYAKAYGRWSDRKDGFLWCKLTQCARHFGYSFEAHNALEDARATAFCYIRFHKELVNELPKAEERHKVAKKEAEELKKEMSKRRELEVQEFAAAQKKKLIIKAIGITVCLVSIVLFFTSCSITGGDVRDTLGFMFVTAIVAFIGLCMLFI